MSELYQSFHSWTRQIQGHISDGFNDLQPMEYFVIAIIALIVGYFLLSGPR